MPMVAMLLVLAAATGDPPLKIAAPGINFVGIDAAKGAFLSEHAAGRLSVPGKVNVITPKDIAAIIGLERQRQLLGCREDQSSCMAEIGDALGANAVLLGEVGLVGKVFAINLKLISPGGALLASRTGKASGEEELADQLAAFATELAHELLVQSGRESPVADVSPARRNWWVPGAAGLAVGIAGGVLLGMAGARYNEIQTAQHLAVADARATASTGSTLQTVGLVCVGVAVAAMAASLIIYFVSGSSPSPSGSTGVVAWELP